MSDSDIEIIEQDSYGNGKQPFSHGQLVMAAISKCSSAGSKEMLEGYFNQRTDREGNIIKIYIEDTRKAFIESVKTAYMMMFCDLDDDAIKNIKNIKDTLAKKFDKLCESEKKDIELAPPQLKRARLIRGIFYREGYLNKNLQYYQEYIEIELDAHRDIVCELISLTARKDFFEGEDLAA